MSRQHASQHHKVGTATKGFGYIAGAGTTAITNDLSTQSMSGIGTFNDG